MWKPTGAGAGGGGLWLWLLWPLPPLLLLVPCCSTGIEEGGGGGMTREPGGRVANSRYEAIFDKSAGWHLI